MLRRHAHNPLQQIGVDGEHDLLSIYRFDGNPRAGALEPGDDGIELAMLGHADKGAVGALDQLHGYAGHVLGHAGDHLRHKHTPTAMGDTHFQHASRAVGNLAYLADHVALGLALLARVHKEDLAGGREGDGGAAHHQLRAELLFQGNQTGAQRLLGDLQLVGRLGEAFVFSQLDEPIPSFKAHFFLLPVKGPAYATGNSTDYGHPWKPERGRFRSPGMLYRYPTIFVTQQN